jgi:hypothetical protein
MACRFAALYLAGLLMLAGCAEKPIVLQDITLANSEAQSPVQAVPARTAARSSQAGADQSSASVVVSGSGATTNIVSDHSFGTGGSASTSTQSSAAGPVAVPSPVAIPSPVQSPTRLATAVMIETAPSTAPTRASAPVASANAAEATGASNPSESAQPEKKIASKVLTLKKTKPGCKGSECPVLNYKRLTFTGYDRFNGFLEQTLLSLALVETNRDQAFRNLTELEVYRLLASVTSLPLPIFNAAELALVGVSVMVCVAAP